MATVTDVLETLFVAQGINQYTAAYDKAVQKNRQLASEQQKVGAAGKAGQAAAALNPVTEGLKSLGDLGGPAAALQAMRAQIDFLTDSFKEFAKAEDVIFRSTILLNNIGSSLKPDALQSMARSLSQMAGIDDEPIVQVGTTLASMGHSGDVTAKTLKSIADAAAGTGMSLDEVTNALVRGSRGSTRALLAMKIGFTATGNEARDFNSILEEFDKRFAGAAEARRDTPAGAIDAMSVAIGNFKEKFGEAFGGVVIPLLHAATAVITYFTKNIDQLFALINPLLGGLLSLSPYKPSFGNIGKGGAGLATEETQKQIAKNTAKLSDDFVRSVLGGPGTVAKQSLNLRDVKLAFG